MINFNGAGTLAALERSPANPELPRISAFPKGTDPWRIDWFGEVGYPNRMLRRSQPSIFVYLSRVLSRDFRADPAALLTPQSTTPAKFQRGCWVSVGTLVLLRIGDIWQDQTLALEPDYQVESFDRVAINKDTTNLIKAGVKPDDSGFLLPLSEHPWHMRATHSYCLMVDLPEGRRLVIPCVELIRFYFGSSSGLISKLFAPPLQRESLYKEADWDVSTRHLKLVLADKISGASAADIGRLHSDPAAWKAAAHVGVSLLKATANGQPAFPQALFPFEGVTNLTCAGKWLSSGESPQKTFLVYQLRSCSHPFPFKSLRYRATGSRRGPPKGDTTTATLHSSHVRRSAPEAADQQLVEREATNKLSGAQKQVRAPVRFPDLMRKFVRREAAEIAADEAVRHAASGGSEIKEVALGEPGTDSRVRSVDLSVVMDPNDPAHRPPPEFLRALTVDLSTMRDVRIALLTRSDDDGWTIPIPVVADEDGVVDHRLIVNDCQGAKSRMRRIAAFSVSSDDESASFVVVEDSTLWWRLYCQAATTDAQRRLLIHGARDFAAGNTGESAQVSVVMSWALGKDD